MPTPPWASDAQLAFLKDRLVAFNSCQSAHTLMQGFWPQTNRDFFERWPDVKSETEGLSDKERKTLRVSLDLIKDMTDSQWVTHRKRTIHNWYYNHDLKKKKRGGKNTSVKITLPKSSSRISTEAHLYSKRYYETKVKHLVDAEIGDRNLKPQDRLAIVNKHLNICFNNKSAEIKAEIRQARDEERIAKELDQSREIAVAQAKAIQELSIKELIVAQAAVPDLVTDFVEQVSTRVGWSWVMIGGGPDAANNGEITTISVHTGQDKYGHTFCRAYKDYVEAVEIPFSNHLDAVYSKAVREKFMSRASTSAVAGTPKDESPPSTPGSTPETEPKTLETLTKPDIAPSPVISATAHAPAAPNVPSNSTDVVIPAATTLDTPPAAALGPDSVPNATVTPMVSPHDLPNPVNVDAPTTSLLGPSKVASINDGAIVLPGLQNVTNPLVAPSPVNNKPALVNDPHGLPGSTSYNAQDNKENQCATHPPFDQSHTKMPQDFSIYPVTTPFSTYYGNGSSTYQNNMTGSGYQFNDGGFGFDVSAAGLSSVGTVDWDAFDAFLDSWSSDMSANTFSQQNIQNNLPPNVGKLSAIPLASGPESVGPISAVTTSGSKGVPAMAPADVAIANAQVPTAGTASSVPSSVDNAPPVEEGTGLELSPLVVEAPRGLCTRKGPISHKVIPLTEKQTKENSWIAGASDYLRTGLESPKWDELVDIWLKFETESSLTEGPSQRLPPKDRPVILSKWLSNRRKFDNVPKVDDVASFGVEWRTWWNGMQPKWRKLLTAGALPQPISVAKNKEDLSVIKKCGPVGLVVAIIALKWWAGDGAGVDWLNAVEDMKASLQALLGGMPNLKRKMDSESVVDVSDKRRKT